MARAALCWTIADLAKESGVNTTSISKFETGSSKLMRANELMIVQAFTNAGLAFINTEVAGKKMAAVLYPLDDKPSA
jgi:hypothetical protein